MSDDEKLVLIVAFVEVLLYYWLFYGALLCVSDLYRNKREIRLLGSTPLLLSSGLLWLLRTWADPIVQGSVGYLLLFSLVGAMLMSIVLGTLPFFGLSWRDDVAETKNPAATTAVCGALAGAMLAFAGSNIGSGPTIWTTLGPAALALLCFWACWWMFETITHCSEAVTLDRDPAAGARLAGFLVAAGAILGRSAAGDWHSAVDTFAGIARGAGVVLALVVVAAVAHRATRPTPERPAPDPLSNGVFPASAFLVASGAWIWFSLPIR